MAMNQAVKMVNRSTNRSELGNDKSFKHKEKWLNLQETTCRLGETTCRLARTTCRLAEVVWESNEETTCRFVTYYMSFGR